MKYFYSIWLVIMLGTSSYARSDSNCKKNLNQARMEYTEGLYLESLRTLDSTSCVGSEVQDYFVLQIQLQLEQGNVDSVQKLFDELFKKFPEYTPDTKITDQRYRNYFSSYEIFPRFSVGIHNFFSWYPIAHNTTSPTFPTASTDYSSDASMLNPGFWLAFNFTRNLRVSAELNSARLSYTKYLQFEDASNVTYSEGLRYLDIPILFSYSFYSSTKAIYYAEAGLNNSFLLSALANVESLANEEINPDGDIDLEKQIDMSPVRSSYLPSALIGVGMEVPTNLLRRRFSLIFAYRLGIGLSSINSSNLPAHNYDLLLDNYHSDDDISLISHSLRIACVFKLVYKKNSTLHDR